MACTSHPLTGSHLTQPMNFGFWNFYNFANNNRMFTDSGSLVGAEWTYPTVYLGKRLRDLGHKVATIDMEDVSCFDKIFFIDYPTILNSYFRKLLRMKHPDVNLILSEPPIVRPDNYNIRNHKAFRRVITWKQDLFERNPKKYINYHLPNKLQFREPPKAFRERKLCVLINSFMYSTHPRELYSERIRAIRWFELNAPADFDLIGVEWDKPLMTGIFSKLNFPLRFAYRRVSLLKKLSINRYPSFIGPNTKAKQLTLQDYRFCIAYENSIEKDYVSEKIFDCLFAGCVPIYLGAPNVLDSIPSNTFIDKRKFPTYEGLYRYLSRMPDSEYQGYLDAAQIFIKSRAIYPFTAEAFAETFTANFT